MLRTHKWSNREYRAGKSVGEPAMDALHREIKEETNLDVTNIGVLVQDCIHSKEFYRDAHSFYELHLPMRRRIAGKLNDEAREFRWVTMADA
jgi:8-oxo-dGTP pyrophosphatase MutT (NUDIX family)